MVSGDLHWELVCVCARLVYIIIMCLHLNERERERERERKVGEGEGEEGEGKERERERGFGNNLLSSVLPHKHHYSLLLGTCTNIQTCTGHYSVRVHVQV